MRAVLTTIQQTLTHEAATVLNHSIAEAGRRNHGQTTPLHVAATLLASQSGFLRQACIRSHPNSSHPLQCRALELCFSVALDRLPTAQNMSEPPISNALLAALKRAQANQRRGCPEQQQQPLLAVKVELEQLIVSILDDPSVSRVMREASFSSPAVKATIEQSLNTSTSHAHHQQRQVSGGNANFGSSFGGIGGRMLPSHPGPPVQNPSTVAPLATRNMYLNPGLQPKIGNHHKGEEVKKVLEIMIRSKKRNPVLVGDSEPEAVVKEFLRKMESKELVSEGILKNVEVVSMEKGFLSNNSQISTKMEELGGLIKSRIRNGGVILDLGNLKWLVQQPTPTSLGGKQQVAVAAELGRMMVAEMARLVARFDAANEGDNKLWLIGTATCETYMRCQVYHSTMENDWDLQAVPLAPRSPLTLPLARASPRLGTERFLSNPVESLNPLKAVPTPLPALTRLLSENLDSAQRPKLCLQCSESFEKELAKLTAIEKSFSDAKQELNRPSLPQWLQNAKLNNSMDARTRDEVQGKDQGHQSKPKIQELDKKWRDTCLHLHPNFHQNTCSERTLPPALSIPNLYNPNMLLHPPFLPKFQTTKPLGEAVKLNTNPVTTNQPAERANSPPGSPVRTDLMLGRKEPGSFPDIAAGDQAKDFLSCISSKLQTKLLEKFSYAGEADIYKKLLKGLMEKAWWQAEAASAVASAITRCRLGNGKPHGKGSRGDVWLLFTGPDRVGKKKMAAVLAEQICAASPIMICLGKRRDDDEVDMNFRGKTAIDRIAEAVRRNPFSVIMLEDIDEADMLLRGSIKQAIEKGRHTDSHGREVGLGNAIFIITGDWSTSNPETDGHFVDEKKLAFVANGGFQLGLIVREKNAKRRANWLHDKHRPLKPRKEMGFGLSLDLNLAAGYAEEDKTDGSHNSSDLTIDHEDEHGLASQHVSIASMPHDLVSNVDDSIIFKPVDLTFVRHEIKKTISVKFSMTVEENLLIEVEDDVLDKILGGLWHDRTSLEEWMHKVISPTFDQLKMQLPSGDRDSLVVQLVVESDFGNRDKNSDSGDWLPSSILVRGL